MPNPKRDGTVESHPFDSAQGRLFRKVRGRMGHPLERVHSANSKLVASKRGILFKNSHSILTSCGFLCVLKLTDLDGSFRELGDDS
jgi:hypothetical protein